MTAERNALEILMKITREGAFANLALKDGFSDGSTTNVGRSTALIYTALENLNYCDFIIDSYAKGRVHSVIRGVLRLALTELFFMDSPDHAVCSKYVELTAEIGKGKLKGFVNGVLRSVARDRIAGKLPPLPEEPAARLEIVSGYPAFMIREYIAQYGESFTEDMLTHRAGATALRPVYPHTAAEIAEHFAQKCVDLVPGLLDGYAVKAVSLGGDVTKDELFMSGAVTVQSESAMLACICLAPPPGGRVLDACAAPGGKTALLYDLMQRRGEIAAWDVHPHRVELILSTLSRLGIHEGVAVRTEDASVPHPELENSFDAVLLDVPCSGLGGGSKPDARYRRTQESIEELSAVQRRILESCSRCLKPGGALVYSTCTLSKREDEDVVCGFLKEHPEFSLDSLSAFLPEKLRQRGAGGMMRLFPNIDDTEGFFIARLIRKAI